MLKFSFLVVLQHRDAGSYMPMALDVIKLRNS